MLDRVIVKNIISLFGMKAASFIIPLITVPYLVRTLGVEGYGYLGFSLAITQYFVLLVNYGFDLSATGNIAKQRDNKEVVSRIFWNVMTIRIVVAFLSFIILILTSIFIPSLNDVLPILLSCFVTVIGTALFPQWIFQGKEQLGLISSIRIFLQLLTIPLLFLFVHSVDDIWQAALINGFPFIGIAVVSIFIINRRCWVFWLKPSWQEIKREGVDGWHIFISTASVNLYTSSVTVILGVFSGPTSVGYYVAADKLIKAALGIYGPVSNAFYPRINAAVAENKLTAKKLIKQLSKIQITISIFLSIGIFLFSEIVVDSLYGAGFQVTISLLKILCWLPIIICLSNIFGVQIMIPFGYKKEFSKVLIISGVLSLFLLIPLVYFFEEYGAAYSVLITELIVMLLMWCNVYRKRILS